jgi:hypothetical protein
LRQGRYGTLLYGAGEVGRSLDLYGEWREGGLNLLQHFVRPGDTIVEVGANVGAHTLFLAQAVGLTGTVVAIEPERLTFQTLCANLALNGVTNVEARPYGPAAQIDGLKLPPCRLLVLHGGTALPLLQAAHSLLHPGSAQSGPAQSGPVQSGQPIVYLEPSPQESAAIGQLLRALGYDLYWHSVPEFNLNNFDRNPTNELGDQTATYLFGLPRSLGIAVHGLQPVQ